MLTYRKLLNLALNKASLFVLTNWIHCYNKIKFKKMDHLTGKTLFAKFSIACAVISLLCLLILHFVSPEFDPGWRMISEYALGNHKMAYYFVFCFMGCRFILHNPVTLEYCDYQMGKVWCTITLSFILWTNHGWDV